MTFMNSISSVSLSGMNAAQTALDAAASNVANASTPDYRRREVTNLQTAQGGVTAEVRSSDAAGPALETDLVAQLQAKNAFLANLAVFKSSNSVAGALLDLKA
jgi:flagellar hook-associated protein FlgK